MKRVIGVLLLVLTVALIYFADNTRFNIPAFGKLLSPTHGIWKSSANQKVTTLKVNTPHGIVDVYYDDRKVPHLFAPNEKALYHAQGFVQAKDRLWQMDFQTRIAGGNLADALGSSSISYDRFFRRTGLSKIADDIVESLKDDSISLNVAQTYADGVNQYIKTLHPADYPIEFKLANYGPEKWTIKKSILLLKLMAFRLSANESDAANTNTLNLIGKETYDILFPDFPKDISPIIPKKKKWKFKPIALAEQSSEEYYGEVLPNLPNPIPPIQGLGSNNWAVGKKKTEDGSVIVCNDPHLWLSYPSIWYEMQLNTPEQNVYGVTIPGAPCIIIGFNENIAWGVTNGTRDVKDWYSVTYKDDSQQEYLFDSSYHQIEERVEYIKVKNGKDLIDTVKWTKSGPIVYDGDFGELNDRSGLAMHWAAINISNELNTFYLLNHAKNYQDYINALEFYDDPGQNFVYGDVEGNIAIKAQGKYRVQNKDDGKFIQRLENQTFESLNTFIPSEHNPQILNPSRNFVSSANQHPADSTYPYYYTGIFETYRNRRINEMLDSLNDITIEDMMWMQNDNYNLMAAEILPFLIRKLSTNPLNNKEIALLDSLRNWDFYSEYQMSSPSYFQTWWNNIRSNLWDEMADTSILLRAPLDYYTLEFLKEHSDHNLIDNKKTKSIETVSSLINSGFKEMANYYLSLDSIDAPWYKFNDSKIKHMMEFDAFSKKSIQIGGTENSINANNGDFGPSWRMIVKLSDKGVEAYGVYPGGQSGNPSDKHYDDFDEHWRTGNYFKLNFFKNIKEAQSNTN